MTETVAIQVNGERHEVPKGLNITQLVAHLGLIGTRLAIERNLEILPRGQWGATMVSGGDRFEIVHLVGGG
jgi:sulfur carrier protein